MAKYTTAQIEAVRLMLMQASSPGVQLDILPALDCGSSKQQNSVFRKREKSRNVRRATATKHDQLDLFGGSLPHDP